MLIPSYFLFDIVGYAHIFLVVITFLSFIIFFYEKKLYVLKFNDLKDSLEKLIVCWPLILLTSLVSMLLFNNFKEQEIVTKLKTDLSFTLLVSSIMIAPVIEEIFFKKFVYRIIKKKFGLFVGAIIVSLMFSVIHYNLYSFGTLFLLSIICTIKYENTGRVIHPILIHSFFNLTMVLLSLIK